MDLDVTRGSLGPRVDLSRRRVWIFLAMVVVATATATSVPWNWRFPLTYFVAAFVFRLVFRTKHHDLNVMVPLVVLGGTLMVGVRTFYGSPWLPGGGVAHVAALYGMSIFLGFLLADWVRPVQSQPTAVEPRP